MLKGGHPNSVGRILEVVEIIINDREKGHSMRHIANECDVSTTIVQKAIKNTVRNTNSSVI